MTKQAHLRRMAQLEKSAGGAERVVVVMESISEKGKFSIDRSEELYTKAEVAEHLPAGNLQVVWVVFGDLSSDDA